MVRVRVPSCGFGTVPKVSQARGRPAAFPKARAKSGEIVVALLP